MNLHQITRFATKTLAMELFNSKLQSFLISNEQFRRNHSPLHTTMIQTYLDSTKKNITCLCSIIPKHLKEHCHQCHHSQTPIRQLRGQFGLLHLWILDNCDQLCCVPHSLATKNRSNRIGLQISLKLTWHLKIDGWNTYYIVICLPFGMASFQTLCFYWGG